MANRDDLLIDLLNRDIGDLSKYQSYYRTGNDHSAEKEESYSIEDIYLDENG